MKRVLIFVQELSSKKACEESFSQILKWLSCIPGKPEFVLLHVIDEALIENAVISGAQVGTGFMDAETLRRTLIEGSIERGVEYLNSLKEDFVGKGYKAIPVVKVGNPVTTVIQESKFHRTDAILLVEHHRSMLGAIFGDDSYGGLSKEIIQKSEVPIAVITPKSIRFTDIGKKRVVFPPKKKMPAPNL